ncbi:MAG: multifunctional CCA tRNA nucleotidyl transferase/2'3'-cyclic phosphodiesterase/2'nucleotidase/phosphatase [Gammaproteobacteria bacterium]|nr:multifunctional CCA tRNA nucleotidyl transferase/2'3'-cyclic phosphodiesterase/2'nucleotidase/phosphatase [Gammaproteobacteria bacterium]MBT5205342.1 multifunctional CCA tRNA nucleotidyl transferase/2'3'-cyclic phosphodiesterase/2'nucleotidase/phosphatase [Gammaproteobacteria bacterium]MBT5601509.1 multifunctional CCA tRNA nucleotidyl transferase/2'3'-cyclic phosphodiesterase/2'nucleotidase/phosphatase [Gammaproteobacteria bacterium]MBT6244074.1 multifunctional CCA tRNA nucleotidyl transferas
MKKLLVGGAVRDKLLGIPRNEHSEQDWVVLGESPESMLEHGFKQVGKAFPVFLHPATGQEYALARKEQNTGPGHQNFTFDTRPDVTLEEDLYRRDLTINAMAEDAQGTIFDPYGGQIDLRDRLLRHVSTAFDEDPLRVFRLARFYARFRSFGFEVHDQTRLLCQNMVRRGDLNDLSSERIFMELEKAMKTEHPEKFFVFIRDIGAANQLWPELTEAGISRLSLLPNDLEPAQKFASLCEGLGEASLKNINSKIKMPKYWQELNLLLARYSEQLINPDTNSAAQIVSTLEHMDARRKPERFEKILQLIQVIQPKPSNETTTKWRKWQALSAATKTKNLSPGLTGPEIKAALRALLIEIIANDLHG